MWGYYDAESDEDDSDEGQQGTGEHRTAPPMLSSQPRPGESASRPAQDVTQQQQLRHRNRAPGRSLFYPGEDDDDDRDGGYTAFNDHGRRDSAAKVAPEVVEEDDENKARLTDETQPDDYEDNEIEDTWARRALMNNNNNNRHHQRSHQQQQQQRQCLGSEQNESAAQGTVTEIEEGGGRRFLVVSIPREGAEAGGGLAEDDDGDGDGEVSEVDAELLRSMFQQQGRMRAIMDMAAGAGAGAGTASAPPASSSAAVMESASGRPRISMGAAVGGSGAAAALGGGVGGAAAAVLGAQGGNLLQMVLGGMSPEQREELIPVLEQIASVRYLTTSPLVFLQNATQLPTPSRGPEGFKQWMEFEEYDIVKQIKDPHISTKKLFLGFNIDDNPYDTAQAFLFKAGLTPDSHNFNTLVIQYGIWLIQLAGLDPELTVGATLDPEEAYAVWLSKQPVEPAPTYKPVSQSNFAPFTGEDLIDLYKFDNGDPPENLFLSLFPNSNNKRSFTLQPQAPPQVEVLQPQVMQPLKPEVAPQPVQTPTQQPKSHPQPQIQPQLQPQPQPQPQPQLQPQKQTEQPNERSPPLPTSPLPQVPGQVQASSPIQQPKIPEQLPPIDSITVKFRLLAGTDLSLVHTFKSSSTLADMRAFVAEKAPAQPAYKLSMTNMTSSLGRKVFDDSPEYEQKTSLLEAGITGPQTIISLSPASTPSS
ncbi:hypothetical protein Pelo_3523 [Pelomyxa schiedti]|nr:hypothetical protein Pelo_3523 [Pelomyxa schiedti]